ncbi:hypothetical protein Lal_00020964 [Lupinus albus]|nr:hypothetical protein Lal_00020964 [Lupinus albus]
MPSPHLLMVLRNSKSINLLMHLDNNVLILANVNGVGNKVILSGRFPTVQVPATLPNRAMQKGYQARAHAPQENVATAIILHQMLGFLIVVPLTMLQMTSQTYHFMFPMTTLKN